MAYLGNSLTVQQYAPRIAYFNGNGSTTAFTLPIAVVTSAQIIVTVDNVIQNPSTAFTVSGTTLTFTSAPLTGTNNIWVEYTSLQTTVNNLPANPSVIGPMNVSINNAVPLGGATNPIVGASGSANNYVQSYVYNTFNGANSSADFTAYPSNGLDSAGWVDMGITSLSFNQAAYSVTGPNEAYLFGSAPAGSGTTGNLVYATDSTGTANSHQWYTNGFTKAKGSWGMQLDSSSNLSIQGATSLGALNIGNGGSGGPVAQYLVRNNAAITSGKTYPSGDWASFQFYQDNTQGFARFLDIVANGLGGSANSNIRFFTQSNPNAPTESMRIDNNGNIYVGNYTTGFGRMVVNATATDIYLGYNNTTKEFAVASNGQIYAQFTSISSLSDQRVKENIKPIPYGLNEIKKLKPITFTFIAHPELEPTYGFIAQEVELVLPELVGNEKDNKAEDGTPYKTLKMGDMLPVLVKAIQEQQTIIEDLKARIETLEAK